MKRRVENVDLGRGESFASGFRLPTLRSRRACGVRNTHLSSRNDRAAAEAQGCIRATIATLGSGH